MTLKPFFLGGVVLGMAACGGSGDLETDPNPRDSGAAGAADASSSTGGAAGGGSGGASGSSAGGDGGAHGGADSGGGSAGAPSAGGSSGGGGSAGSSGGSSGGGAGGVPAADGGTTPRCEPLCTAFTGAACSTGPTRGGCLLTCRALTSSSACNDQANAYFDCAEATTIQCTAAGDPFAQGCGVLYLRAIGCAVSENPNPGVVAPCDAYCDKVVAAGCANNAAKPECNTNCLWAGATGTGCDDEWQTYLTCANAAQFSCLLGFAVAQGCGQAFRAYGACINAAGS